MIYLDCNATTPVDPEVQEAISACLRDVFGNPSSSHSEGRKARALVDGARANVAELIGCEPEEIIFTSGGTESNNLAIVGTALRHAKGHVVTSLIEHPSVMNAIRHLEGIGFEVTFVGVDENCRVSPEEIEAAVREDTVLITIMHSNNETGTLQPVDEIAAAARRRRITFHTDAAQSVGKVEVNSKSADMLTVAGHKFYGPKGVGALYVRNGHEPLPIMFGAAHERGLRPGTENVPGIAGLGKAAEISGRELETRIKDTLRLRAILYGQLENGINGLRLNGHPQLTLPGTLNLVFPGTNSAETVDLISSKVAVSAGAACHGGISTPSSVLKAMGLSDEDALASLRISIGKDNTEEEIRVATGILLEIFRRTGRK